MRPLHIIMPMAGEGSRFLKEGWTTPKPLIKLHGKELFLRAIDSVYINEALIKYSFIVRQEHIDKYQIDKKIIDLLPSANVFSVAKTTRGAVETCLKARQAISQEDSLIIMDCDLEFSSKSFINKIKEILLKPIDAVDGGILLSFNSDQPKYSYAEIDENNNVIRTAEKEVISNHALCGAYFFAKSQSFLNVADEMINDTNFSKPEFYVSLLFNSLLKNGEHVKLAKMEKYASYGTPEELKQYL